MFTWVETSLATNNTPKSKIGIYSYAENTLKTLYIFNDQLNVIQSSVNENRSLLGYIIKEEFNHSFVYKPYVIKLESYEVCALNIERSKQIMIQFLYKKQSVLNEKQKETFLLLIHEECKLQQCIKIIYIETITKHSGFLGVLQYQISQSSDTFAVENFVVDSLVRVFIWAQWDPVYQILYYIHYKKPMKCLVEGEESEHTFKVSPTLSGLQFHDDLPHETVVCRLTFRNVILYLYFLFS